MSTTFFGGDFFGGPFFEAPPQVVYVSSGGGKEFDWQDHVNALYRKKHLERHVSVTKTKLKAVKKKIKAIEKKVSKPEVSAGILANLHLLSVQQEELKLEIRQGRQELLDIQTLLITGLKQREYEEEEDDEDVLLLL